MARVKGPLMSTEASGNTTGGKMQFRTTPTGTHVYQPPAPSTQNQQPPSPAQEAQRLRFKQACSAWQALTLEEKASYNAAGFGLNMTGLSLFIREYLDLAVPP